jgi:hypothetical protein
MLSNCSWNNGKVTATLRQPFDLLAKTNASPTYREAGKMDDTAKKEIWLPFLNTYRTMCLVLPPEFRWVLEEIREMRLAA